MSVQPKPVRAAQQVIMRDVLRWALPTCMVLSVITLSTALITGMFPRLWSRGVPSFLLFGFSVVGVVLLRRGRLQAAVASLMAGLGSVLIITLTFNGGLRAPAAMLLFFLVALCGWVFGRRAAGVMALTSVAIITLYFVLGVTGVLSEPSLVPLAAQYVMLLVMTGLIWGTSASPPSRMRAALVEAETRERQLREEQARRLEVAQQFQAVFDQTPHLMALLTPEGIMQSANRVAARFTGAEASQALGRPFAQGSWWPESERASVEQAVLRARDGVVRFETTNVDAQKNKRTIDFSLSPFRDESGQLRFLIAEGRDITDFVQARERKNTTQRLELVGQLAGGVAHDFNNVLMAILASAEVLRLDLEAAGQDLAPYEESLGTILDAGRRASDLTRRLLTFGRRGTLQRRAVSLHGVFDSAARLLERTLPANIRLQVEPRAKTDLVDGDVAALESAVLNLALNARDAMPAGGTLTFSSEGVVLDEDWCRGSGFDLKPGPHLRVSVRDTGTGIAPEHLAHVFEPFFTTKEEGKGTGLGLASVFGVVREHGGAVHVYSEPQRGTVFHLTLPLSSAEPVAAREPGATLHFPGLRVLVVDDEAPIRTMLAQLLGRLGAQCTLAGTAEEAQALFEDRVDLLVTDVVLPGRRGNELALELLEKKPSLRVLLISGFPKDSELATLPAARVRLLGKPFTFATLQQVLGELIIES